MTVRRDSNTKADFAVREIKKSIGLVINEPPEARSLDQMVRLAVKAGYTIVVACVRI